MTTTTTTGVGSILNVNEAAKIIANLFTLTHDPVVKDVLSKYSISMDDASNHTNLKKTECRQFKENCSISKS